MLLERISEETGLSPSYIAKLGRMANHQYKLYTIAKKRGVGRRPIAHPSRKLKFLQRWIVGALIDTLPIHEAAAAYQPGSSVRKNAEQHVRNNFLLKLDFKDFFPSITDTDVVAHLKRHDGELRMQLSETERRFVASVVTRLGHMPIGAPSSPVLSNQIMHSFDSAVSDFCQGLRVAFTRYADDLFFSTNEPNVLGDVHRRVQALLTELPYPKLRLNTAKTVYTSRRRRRLVTGLVLTSDKKISIGRSSKRYIKSLIHRFKLNELSAEEREYLTGYLAYIGSVDPLFLGALKMKYGGETISDAGNVLATNPDG